MAIKLASLFIELAVNGDKLTAELKKSSSRTKQWSKDISKATDAAKRGLAKVTVGAGLAAAGLTAVYASNAKSLDKLGKLAAQLDDQADSLRVVGAAAEYAGVGAETMYKNLERMTRRLGDAADGTGPAADAIDELGLNMDELLQLSPTEAFEAIAGALDGIEGPAQRAAIASALFGKDGLSALNLTTDVLKKAGADVEALGGALTNLEIARIEEANDSVARVSLGVDLLSDRFTAKLAPGVEFVANRLFEAAAQGDQFESVMDKMILTGLSGISSVANASGSLIRFIDDRKELAAGGILGYVLYGKKGFAIGVALASVKDGVLEIADDIRLKFSGSADAVEVLEDKIESLKNTISTKDKDAGLPLIGKFFQGAADTARKELQAAQSELARLTSGVPIYASALDETADFATVAADGFEFLSASLDDVISKYGQVSDVAGRTPLVEPDFNTETVATAGAEDAANDDNASNGYDDGYIEQFKKQQEEELRLKSEFRAAYFADQLNAEKLFQDTWTLFQDSGAKDRLKILFRETSGALATLAQHSRTMFELNKAVGLGNATVSIATGIAKALELPFPANIGAAFTVALEGAAQIKTITSAKFGKAEVTTPGASAPAPVTDVGSANSSTAANDSSVLDGVGNQNSGFALFQFTAPGATNEQIADQTAQMFQVAQDNDMLVPDGNGGFTYTGSGSSNYEPPVYERVS